MAIHLPLAKLSSWQQTLFCCALLERMLPNYFMFSQAANFGDSSILRNQLNMLWQKLDTKQKIKVNIDAQIEKLELEIPEPESFNFFGVYPALDTCMAMMSLLQGSKSKDVNDFINVSKLSYNSVSYYVELIIEESLGDGEEVTLQAINEHPLMVWEKATQNELFDFIKSAPESNATCQQAKDMVLAEGLSNLGIEIAD